MAASAPASCSRPWAPASHAWMTSVAARAISSASRRNARPSTGALSTRVADAVSPSGIVHAKPAGEKRPSSRFARVRVRRLVRSAQRHKAACATATIQYQRGIRCARHIGQLANQPDRDELVDGAALVDQRLELLTRCHRVASIGSLRLERPRCVRAPKTGVRPPSAAPRSAPAASPRVRSTTTESARRRTPRRVSPFRDRSDPNGRCGLREPA